MLRVRPELIEELDHAGHQINAQRNAGQRHRQIEDPTGECAGAGLAQRGGQVELFALVMHHVRCPEQADGVAPAVVPVVAKIVEDEREDPHAPVAGGQMHQRPMLVDPFVEEDSEESEEHAHAGADDAAAQAIDGIRQMVAARMARAIDNQSPARSGTERPERPAPRPFRKDCPSQISAAGDSLKIADTAPCGSAITAIRPTPSTVIGGTKELSRRALWLWRPKHPRRRRRNRSASAAERSDCALRRLDAADESVAVLDVQVAARVLALLRA